MFNEIAQSLRRNKLLIEVIALAFFMVIAVSGLLAFVLLLASPRLVSSVQTIIGSSRAYIAIPPPYSSDLYNFIFLNNIGHYWNPMRVWVWIPLLGAFSLGLELLLNAVVIGVVASFATITRGALFTIAGLTPHGIFEIPAFVLEFAGLARWHLTSTRALRAKFSGRNVDRPQLKEGLKDTVVLSIFSVVLFALAAYVESYVTPRFLGQ